MNLQFILELNLLRILLGLGEPKVHVIDFRSPWQKFTDRFTQLAGPAVGLAVLYSIPAMGFMGKDYFLSCIIILAMAGFGAAWAKIISPEFRDLVRWQKLPSLLLATCLYVIAMFMTYFSYLESMS